MMHRFGIALVLVVAVHGQFQVSSWVDDHRAGSLATDWWQTGTCPTYEQADGVPACTIVADEHAPDATQESECLYYDALKEPPTHTLEFERANQDNDNDGADIETNVEDGILTIVFTESAAYHPRQESSTAQAPWPFDSAVPANNVVTDAEVEATMKTTPDTIKNWKGNDIIFGDPNDPDPASLDSNHQECQNKFVWYLESEDCDRRKWRGEADLRQVLNGASRLNDVDKRGDGSVVKGCHFEVNDETREDDDGKMREFRVVRLHFGVRNSRSIRMPDGDVTDVETTFKAKHNVNATTMMPIEIAFPMTVDVKSENINSHYGAEETCVRLQFGPVNTISDMAALKTELATEFGTTVAHVEDIEEIENIDGKDYYIYTFEICPEDDGTDPEDMEENCPTDTDPPQLLTTLSNFRDAGTFSTSTSLEGASFNDPTDPDLQCGVMAKMIATRALVDRVVVTTDPERPEGSMKVILYTEIQRPFRLIEPKTGNNPLDKGYQYGEWEGPWHWTTDVPTDHNVQADVSQYSHCSEQYRENALTHANPSNVIVADDPQTANGTRCVRYFSWVVADSAEVCTFTETYQVVFKLACWEQYTNLTGWDCPLSNQGTERVEISFDIDSGNHCPTLTDTIKLEGKLESYQDQPQPDQLPGEKFNAFINNQRMHFRAKVFSNQVNLKGANLEKVWICNGAASTYTLPDALTSCTLGQEELTADGRWVRVLYDTSLAAAQDPTNLDNRTALGQNLGFEYDRFGFDQLSGTFSAHTFAGGVIETNSDWRDQNDQPTVNGETDSDATCTECRCYDTVTDPRCYVMPRFEFQATVFDSPGDMTGELPNAIPVVRDDVDSFTVWATVSVIYQAVGVNDDQTERPTPAPASTGARRLLTFSTPARQLLQAGAGGADNRADFAAKFDLTNQYDPATAPYTAAGQAIAPSMIGALVAAVAALLW